MNHKETFLELVLSGAARPEMFNHRKIEWEVNPEGQTLAENMGIKEHELEMVLNGSHSFLFIAYRLIHKKHNLDFVLPGAYVQFAVEYSNFPSHIEYGWVDKFNSETKRVELQCDDNNEGKRSIEIDLEDITQLLPLKERPNIYYKAMLCKNCKDCNRESGEFIENCSFYPLFSEMKENRVKSNQIIGRFLGYGGVKRTSCGNKGNSETSSSESVDISSEPERHASTGSDSCMDCHTCPGCG